MDLLFEYGQEKVNKKLDDIKSSCSLTLNRDETSIYYDGKFHFEYTRYGEKRSITYSYFFSVNIKTGDIHCVYSLLPSDNKTKPMLVYRTLKKDKKNNFELLRDTIDD